MTRAGRARLLLALLAIAALPLAQAGKVYRWVDRQGVVHYGDRAPEANAVVGGNARVKVIPVRAEPGAMVALRLERDGQGLPRLRRQPPRRPGAGAAVVHPFAQRARRPAAARARHR